MLIQNKIIAVLTINDSNKILDLAKCLNNSGIINLDIRLRTKEAKNAIKKSAIVLSFTTGKARVFNIDQKML